MLHKYDVGLRAKFRRRTSHRFGVYRKRTLTQLSVS